MESQHGGTAHQHKLHEIEVKLNNIVRTITQSKKFSHATCIYKKLNFLKLKNVYKLDLAKFMLKLFYNRLPIFFITEFIESNNIHSHETKKPNQSTSFLSHVNKIACQHKLNYRRVKLWSEIRDELKNKAFNLFKKNQEFVDK